MIEALKNILGSLIEVVTLNLANNQTIQNVAYRGSKKLQLIINLAILKLTGVVLIALSITNSYFVLAERYDNNAPFKLGLIGISGIFLLSMGIITIILSGRKERRKRKIRKNEQEEMTEDSRNIHLPILEQAIAAFIFDLIKEREEKREERKAIVLNKENEQKSSEDIPIIQ